MPVAVVHDPEVLIVGAGPTGLVLALWLQRMGVRIRIIDSTAEPGTTSRALAVQARTLEYYQQIGLAAEVVARGRPAQAINLWVAGKKAAHAVFTSMGEDVSSFPFPLIFPQDEHERLLIDRLTSIGAHVERQTTLLGFTANDDGVVARLKRADAPEETCQCLYIAGCDGAKSTVRDVLGIGFPGGTYESLFYVADVDAQGETTNGELHVGLDKADFLALFPMRAPGRMRLVGTIRESDKRPQDQLSWNDVRAQVLSWMPITVKTVNWFSTYRVHHRVADRFRDGRAFLLGDAGHIHSPVGGQGMNTGIGDAINLGWKLAAVLRGRASASILDTFEPERIAFARRLVATTDQAFTAVTSSTLLARFIRLTVVPFVLPLLFAIRTYRRFMFRTISQTSITYRLSALSAGRAGVIHGGDRLPWVRIEDGTDNFAPLISRDWQLHIYGEATQDLRASCEAEALPLHVFPWQPRLKEVGLRRNAAYLIRPDGHIGLVDSRAQVSTLVGYLRSHGIACKAADMSLPA